jgi:hypothetical protein
VQLQYGTCASHSLLKVNDELQTQIAGGAALVKIEPMGFLQCYVGTEHKTDVKTKNMPNNVL